MILGVQNYYLASGLKNLVKILLNIFHTFVENHV